MSMHRRLTRTVAIGGLAAMAAAMIAHPGLAVSANQANEPNANARNRTYEVTVENLTTGQPFSPGVVVTHSGRFSLFREGDRPSPGIIAIAEDGMPMTATEDLKAVAGVSDVVTIGSATMPIHRRGGPGPSSITVTIDAGPGATQISLATMLICTNDGFTGVSSMRLPMQSSASSHEAGVWDAGSEVNDELFASIVDPCQMAGPVAAAADGNNNNLPEDGGKIRGHPGIEGNADLTSAHRWTGPVARITVRRIR